MQRAAAAGNSSKSGSKDAESPRSEGRKPKFGWFNMKSKKSQATDGSSSNASAEQPASPAWGGTSATDWGGQGVEEEARGDPLGGSSIIYAVNCTLFKMMEGEQKRLWPTELQRSAHRCSAHLRQACTLVPSQGWGSPLHRLSCLLARLMSGKSAARSTALHPRACAAD